MTTWVLREGRKREWPFDLICVRDGDWLIWLHDDGGFDVCHIEMGLPCEEAWMRFG